MREILFKGKQTYDGKWVEGFYYLKRDRYVGDKEFISEKHMITTGIVEASGSYQESEETIEYSVIPETVGQYTGLTDKNGNKIFEGDIVKARWRKQSDYALGMVIFENGTFKIKVLGTKKQREFEKYTDADVRAYAIENNFLNRGFNIEVIGNIHENPELLKGGTEE
jgi:uncharacterized phage protein (TIGR01671 family)